MLQHAAGNNQPSHEEPRINAMKNTRAVVIVPVASVSLAVVQFLAVNGPADGAEIPHRPPLTVQFLLSLLAQLILRDKSGHDHHLPSHGVKALYHGQRNAASVCFL